MMKLWKLFGLLKSAEYIYIYIYIGSCLDAYSLTLAIENISTFRWHLKIYLFDLVYPP